jgi:hypothetical protein
MRAPEFITEKWEKDNKYNFKNPLPYSNSSHIWDFFDIVEEAYFNRIGKTMNPKELAERYGKRISVPIDKIISTEKWLNKEQLDSILNGAAKSSSKLPIFYFKNGKYITVDGNHRVVAGYLRNESNVEGFVLSLDFITYNDQVMEIV